LTKNAKKADLAYFDVWPMAASPAPGMTSQAAIETAIDSFFDAYPDAFRQDSTTYS
jgi:hypothetical protein